MITLHKRVFILSRYIFPSAMSYVDGSDAGSDSSSSSSSTVAPGSAANKRPKPPQDAINEFWSKFAAKTPSKGMVQDNKRP